MKRGFTQIFQYVFKIAKFAACSYVYNQRRLTAFIAVTLDFLNKFRNKRYGQIVNAEKMEILEGFQYGSLAGSAHTCNYDKFLK
jgi:hypothetical protein